MHFHASTTPPDGDAARADEDRPTSAIGAWIWSNARYDLDLGVPIEPRMSHHSPVLGML
ncbi:hypothetical protein MPC4_20284 [Methylocella tundrae]|uniref:Uncharacterized protein n=1 Tax=Methylocella tundrae TaxID=227605 RepID=A0A8B6M5F7_METTU|nr:hypothetical protein [Methylocella tundrae]VTZ50074.1 hypothetical protein MPC4_20284 [Methylocella tundrae]